MTTIESAAAVVPETSVSLAELAGQFRLEPAQVQAYGRFMGFDRIALADQDLGDMLLAAARQAVDGVDPASVRYLVYAHTMAQTAPPGLNLVQQLRDRLGLPRATAFSMTQQSCATGLSAISLTARLIARTTAQRALVVSGEHVFTPAVRFIPGVAVIGDGASACLVGPAGDRLVAAQFRTLGEFYQGVALTPADDLYHEYHRRYAVTFADVIDKALRAASLRIADVALIVPQNVNRMSWKTVAKRLRIPLDRLYLDTLPRIGHLNCADPIVNLVSARRAGRIAPGDHYVLAASGIGAVFAALVLQARGDAGEVAGG